MGNCIRGSKYRWPDGRVPYVVDGLDAAEKDQVQLAVDIWNGAGVGVTFVRYTGPRSPGVPPYVVFVPGDDDSSCHTDVGRRRPGQKIYCHLGFTTLVHEMGHTLGLKHEQQRFDRNNHIAVLTDNIIADRRGNFSRLSVDEAIPVGPYDYESRMHYGESSFAVDFRVNVEVPGVSSPHAPAAAIFDNALHLVWADADKRLWHTSSEDLGDFPSPRRISGQTSKAGPALAAFGDRLVMVHLGESSDDVWISESNGRTFGADDRIDGVTSSAVPALAAAGGELHLCWKGRTSTDLWHSWSDSGDADDWSTPKRIGQTSKAAPAMTATGATLHLTHLGQTSSQLWYSASTNRRTWSPNDVIGQSSKTTPAMSASGSTVHLAHLGESSSEIWHATKPSGGDVRTNRKTNQRSSRAPALASGTVGGVSMTVLVHRGETSNRVYVSRYDPALVTMVGVNGGPAGGFGGSQLTDGDLATVRFMYG